jgi:hypothetical protein
MARRIMILLLVAALASAVAGLLWAQGYGQSSDNAMTTDKAMTSGKTMGNMPSQNEYTRCTKTCSMLVDFYHKQFTTMKTHEGDKTCWSNCWTRYGQGGSPSAADQKTLWFSKVADNMRANQCAQACWRTHHSDSRVVAVAGWRSEPRPNTLCYR